MFTGIIQEIGTVVATAKIGGGVKLTVEAPRIGNELSVNDSVSINGVCQTVVHKDSSRFEVVAVEETLGKTTLAHLKAGSPANLELAMQLGDRLGGHLVSGHVDCVGQIIAIVPRETSWLFKIAIPAQFKRYVIPVGSIAIDGVSLTIATIDGNTVTVSIIPHTMENTIFSSYVPDTAVNLEFDLVGKYIERLLAQRDAGEQEIISSDRLKAWGYDL